MSNRVDKPMRSPVELATMLRDKKGITFQYMSFNEACIHLSTHNNYLRTASYRKNYDKHSNGKDAGKYIHLDFAYLVELSKLDMYLRTHLLQMCIDVEHGLKVAMIADIESNPAEDGYSIVDDFLASSPDVKSSIAAKAGSVYTGDLVKKYFTLSQVTDSTGHQRTEITAIDCPIWVLVETLAFNDFLRFCRFYAVKYPGRMNLDFKRLNTVRSLRNACAHNNCILISLRPGTTSPMSAVSQRIQKIPTIGKEERKKKLSCRPLFEITCLLMEYEIWVSEKLRRRRLEALRQFAHGRMVSHAGFFAGNPTVSTAIDFLRKVIDNFA